MANTKISALTSATTPVAGTEVLPIVQTATTVKLAISDLTPGLSTITATKGGTGQTSYAVGDLLYASTTTALSKLADVATGNALISGGVGVAPSYGKIGLTTHVSGVLPVANGGTNASTASITSFNNITGYTASGATGTTSTNLVFSTSPTLTTPSVTGDATLSTGNLVIGTSGKGITTGSSISLGFGTNGNTAQATLSTSNEYRVTGKITSSTNASDLFAGDNGSSAQFSVTNTGVIYARNTTIQSLSDQRLKENVVNSNDGLNIINQLRPVRYDWKQGYGDANQLGFIAQEVEQVFPEMIGEWKIKDSEDAYKTIGTTALIPVLVKAIQQQQAMIESLNSKIEALQIK